MSVSVSSLIEEGRCLCYTPPSCLPPSERELEDHEQVVDVYSTWPREHSNVFLFKQNEKKYDLFEDPIVSDIITFTVLWFT